MAKDFEEHMDTLWTDNPLVGVVYHRDWLVRWRDEMIVEIKNGMVGLDRSLERVEGLISVLDGYEGVLKDGRC